MWSVGRGVAVIKVTPSDDWNRCQAPWGNDRNHSGADRKRLWRPIASHDVERRAAVEDMHKFVSLHVTFPGTFSGKLTREDGAVAIGC